MEDEGVSAADASHGRMAEPVNHASLMSLMSLRMEFSV